MTVTVDDIKSLLRETTVQIPLLISLVTWWKTCAIIFVIITIVLCCIIIYLVFFHNVQDANKTN